MAVRETSRVTRQQKPGYGVRHPDIDRLVTGKSFATQETDVWSNGTLPLRVSAYLGLAELPSEFVTSVRCIVRVSSQIVLCESVDSLWSAWPGGRRTRDESYADTASREVHEETGWLLDRDSIEQVGWLHVELLATPPAHYPYPHPDFVQLVMVATATECDTSRGMPWIDTEGHIVGSRLATTRQVLELVRGFDRAVAPFLNLNDSEA